MTYSEKLQYLQNVIVKSEKVVNSCSSTKQLVNAKKYIGIVMKRMFEMFPITFANPKFPEDIKLLTRTQDYLKSIIETKVNSL